MTECGMRRSRQPFAFCRHRSSVDISVENPNAALEYEIAQEQAASLGRLGRRLEAALAALRAFDASDARAKPGRERETLLEKAGTLLWHFIVQREACGLRDGARVMQDYGVPGEVRARMGVFPSPTTRHGRQRTEKR
jgi:hypothetical protein